MEHTNVAGKMPVIFRVEVGLFQITYRLFMVAPNEMMEALQEEDLKHQSR